jgi:U4/U6.U5 tri-snRNP-associated protein 3
MIVLTVIADDSDDETTTKKADPRVSLTGANGDDEEGDEVDMQAFLGFGSFDSTKGKEVADNTDGAASKNKKRIYRQYMNRRGGFNRPLQKVP